MHNASILTTGLLIERTRTGLA